MKFEHIAVWVKDLELMKDFYLKYFRMNCSDKYINSKKSYSSYFLSFDGQATRIEIMHRPDISDFTGRKGMSNGLAHVSISLGSREKVDELTELIRKNGYTVTGEPRTTGDGYYESVILDPEGNYVELTE
jgi:lactoylglutathione lyase